MRAQNKVLVTYKSLFDSLKSILQDSIKEKFLSIEQATEIVGLQLSNWFTEYYRINHPLPCGTNSSHEERMYLARIFKILESANFHFESMMPAEKGAKFSLEIMLCYENLVSKTQIIFTVPNQARSELEPACAQQSYEKAG